MLDKHIAVLVGYPDFTNIDEEQKQLLMSSMYGFAVAYAAETGDQISARRIHSMGDYHEFVAPAVNDSTEEQEFDENDMFAVIQDWTARNQREAKELAADAPVSAHRPTGWASSSAE